MKKQNTPILIKTLENDFVLEQNSLAKLVKERKKIRALLVVEPYADNWPYINPMTAKMRAQLLHKLRLVDEAILKAKEEKNLNKKLKKVKPIKPLESLAKAS
ncbi:MAG: hypothetical protein IPK14_25620 [Blastocatellia bacterium]|nr:hypothetical protein [Blastocatellia bacterium]MBL8196968.1 hypothetical protein [Blastocatellia bacterium]MBN8725492.1 hypothetical protein [Acidobacteriota bacterium]